MSLNPLFDSFSRSVVRPLTTGASETCCAAKSLAKRVCQAGSAAFSGAGNWPFYGVAATFGSRYSSTLGNILGACEFTSYFTFRIRNFEEIRQKIFSDDSELAEGSPEDDIENSRSSSTMEETYIPSVVSEEDSKQAILSHSSKNKPKNTLCCSGGKLKDIAFKTGIAALGLIAQFPLMVLVYYANGENLVYPMLSGVCEASFTILSLFLSFESSKKVISPEQLNPELESKRTIIEKQINRFLEELPTKYKDPAFVQRIETIFSNHPPKTEEECGRALLDLVFEAQGLPEQRNGSWDGVLSNLSKGIGLLIAGYITTVNGAVTYKGVKAWRSDQEALAILTTVFVSLANIKLLTKLCMDSATGYYEGLRDIFKGQYRPPLACSVSPVAWGLGRMVSNALSWLSFGTTAISARDYIPKVGNALIAPAPLSSALLLNENLNAASDDLLLWGIGKVNPKAERFNHLRVNLSSFRDKIQTAGPQALRKFLSHTLNLHERSPQVDVRTPLLMDRLT